MNRKKLIAMVAALAALALVVTGTTVVLAHDPETGEAGCGGKIEGVFQGRGHQGSIGEGAQGLEECEACLGNQEHYVNGWMNGSRIGMFRHALVEELAENLGLAFDELMEDIQAGQTIAQIAEAEGIDVDTLIDAALAPYQDIVDQLVADGYLNGEEAAQLLADTRVRLEEIVNNDWSELEKSWCGNGSGQSSQEPGEFGKAFSRGCRR
jgi:hypothetical protein